MDNAETLGQRILRMRKEKGLKQDELGVKAGYDRTSISRAERDVRYSPELVRALDIALEADGALLEMVSPIAAGAMTPYPDEVVTATIQIGGITMSIPMDRRRLFEVAASAGIAAAALPTRVHASPQVAVRAWRSELYRYTELGRVCSADEVSALMISQVAAIDALRRRAPEPVRRELLVLGSRYCEYIGWMRQEAHDLTGAWYWSDRASEWATAAGWEDMPPYILARKANMAWSVGDWAQSVDLARAAYRATRIPGIRAQAAMQEARAHALAAHTDACSHALDRARSLLDPWERQPEGDPIRVLGKFSVSSAGQIDHVAAWCWAQTGRSDDAVGVYERELARMPEHIASATERSERLDIDDQPRPAGWVGYDSTRRRAEYQGELAVAYARAGAPDQAIESATHALARVERIKSASVTNVLGGVVGALARWNDRDDVRDVTHRIRELTA